MNVCFRLWFVWLILSSKLLAQPFTARTLSLQQGLPEYYVSGLIQDKAGFIWVATRDGLARYDGRQFKVFRHRPSNDRTLASNVILSIQLVSDSIVIIKLENRGFQLFNPITEQFSDLLTNQQLLQKQVSLVNAYLTPDQKQLWGRSNTQLTRFDRRTGQFKTVNFPNLPSSTHHSGNSLLLSKQHLYAPVPGRLVEFDTQNGQFKAWDHERVGLPGQIETYYGTSLSQRANGDVLISAAGGLLSFIPQTHHFRFIPVPSPLHTQAGPVYQAPDGQVYFTYGMTVYRLSPDDQLTPIWTAPRLDYRNYFHALLVDRSGVLWIGTNGDGIQQIDLRALPIKTYPYRTNFVYDVLSELGISPPDWIKTDQHIYRLRFSGIAPYMSIGIDGGSYQLFRGDPTHHRLQPVLAMPHTIPWNKPIRGAEGGNGLRVLSDGTVWMYDPYYGLLKADSTGQLPETFACPVDWVSSIQPIGQWVWIGSEWSGLYAYNPQTRRIVRQLRDAPAGAQSIPSDQVLSLVADPHNPHVRVSRRPRPAWAAWIRGRCAVNTGPKNKVCPAARSIRY